MSDLTKPEHVPSCVSTGEGVTVPSPTPRSDAMQASGKAHYMSLDLARTLERELTEARATLLAREGELDSMSAALAAKDREIKEERKRTATQEHVKNGVYMLADAWKARAEKAEAELASMRNRTPFLELSKCEQELFAAERDAAEAKRLLEADGKIRLHIVAERDQLHARVADLERQLAESGKDKERIDWLENQGHLIARQYRDGWHFDASNDAWVCVNATTLRAAIDSAREAQP